MLTRYIHAFDESAAIEKLREIVADDSDGKLVMERYRVFRVKRTMWQRAVGDEPKWKVDYSLENNPSFEGSSNNLAPELHETVQDNWHETVQETVPAFVSETEQETRKLDEQELPNPSGWDTMVDNVFRDFDPKR